MYDKYDIYDEILDRLQFYIKFLQQLGITVSFSEISSEVDHIFPVLVAYRDKLSSGITIPVFLKDTQLLELHIAITGIPQSLENPLDPKVYSVVHSDTAKEDKLQIAANGLINTIFDIHKFVDTFEKTRDKKYDAFVKAIKFMFANYHRSDLTAIEVARAISYSHSHLDHVFKRFSRSTPSQYLLHVRLKESEKMLRNTEYPISTIATLAGFKNANYFSIAFKARYNMSPREWRIENKK